MQGLPDVLRSHDYGLLAVTGNLLQVAEAANDDLDISTKESRNPMTMTLTRSNGKRSNKGTNLFSSNIKQIMSYNNK